MSKSLIGISINNDSVSMAQLDGDKATLAVKRLPGNLVNDSQIVSSELLAKTVKSLKKEKHFSGNKCALVLPEDSTFLRIVSSPAISANQLKLNIPYEFKDFIGSESINYNYDYIIDEVEYDEQNNPKELKILAAAGNKNAIAQYKTILKKAGLSLKIALPSEMAIINLVKKGLDANIKQFGEFCLVSVGYQQTKIYIFDGKQIKATKTIDLGCQQIDESIASKYNIDIYLAASYRLSNHNSILSEDVCKQVYTNIALDVRKTINFYSYENHTNLLTDVFFCSMGSQNQELTHSIIDYLGYEYKDLDELLPFEFLKQDDANECITPIGIVM